MKILITGSAGFIGSHLTNLLHDKKYIVQGLDNFNEYYDLKLKKDRASLIKKKTDIEILKIDICNYQSLFDAVKKINPDIVIHLAAQAGVRYSITNPESYLNSNINGLFNLLEVLKELNIKNLLFASSSSVYGNSKNLPFKENHVIDNPVSFYAASKISGEALVQSYSNLYGIKSIILRFFTVYGPFGRPDMAHYSFTNKILNNEEIPVFADGELKRDFTYIDDITNSIFLLIKNLSKVERSTIFNIGNQNPISVLEFIKVLEEVIGKKSIVNFKPFQKGDVESTFSDSSKLNDFIKFKPNTNLHYGIEQFFNWYKNYYRT